MTKYIFLFFLSITLFISGCSDPEKDRAIDREERYGKQLDFSSIFGIKYIEVKRRFSTGLSFNEMGFQQEPTWIIQFKSNDTVMAWSPQKLRMQPFYLLFDHGDVYNFAKEYFRIKKISKDSLLFQRLHLKGKEISSDIRSDVNIVYYSEDYIKNTLKTTAEILQRPTAADTAYIKKLTAISNKEPANPKKAFAGRKPVVFTPSSSSVKVKKISTVDRLMGRTESYDYLFPTYRIEINKAYKDFAYEISAVVDAQGKINLTDLFFIEKEFKASRIKTVEAIIDVYLKNLVKVTPGETLGIPHSSEIKLIIVGKK
ncbi:MAG: hypothetical protein EOO92_04350 [Pedobacter sp.]|nr:MAG: hypothetical protein EOO92_04350 [Pedobacter sp.]